jgi:HEAT repeat protein
MAWDKNSNEGPDPRAFRAITVALGDHCIQVRYEAIKALIMIGPPAIPNDNLGRMAANADRNNAISKLESLLNQRDKVQAVWAQMALMRMDMTQINDSNLKAMAKILKLGDSHVRCNAAQALATAWMLAKRVPNPPNPNSIAPKSGWGVAVNELMERLSDKDLQVVFCGINALGEFGVAAMKAKPQLEMLTQHNDQLVREAAKTALVKITGREKMDLGEANRAAP